MAAVQQLVLYTVITAGVQCLTLCTLPLLQIENVLA